jgi:pimeloyl-ACP methyl ester carboxylesterase
MDALRIDRAIIAGFDWGARTANIVAALWHERCKAMISVSGYLIGSQEAGNSPLPAKAEYATRGPQRLCQEILGQKRPKRDQRDVALIGPDLLVCVVSHTSRGRSHRRERSSADIAVRARASTRFCRRR